MRRYIVNLHGSEAYCVATRTACSVRVAAASVLEMDCIRRAHCRWAYWIVAYITSCRLEAAPQYAPAQACKWWHDIHHTRIWIRYYLDIHVGLPVQPTKVAWWPWPLTFDLESGVRVTSDVGYLCDNFSFLGLSVLSTEARGTRQTSDRQTTDAHHRLIPPRRGIIIYSWL